MKLNSLLKTNAIAIAAIMFAGTAMSFKIAEKNAADQTFYYVSENMSEGSFHNAGNWNTSNSDNINCSTTRVRPCKITVPEGSTLSDVLGSKTNDQVLDISEGYKPAP
ncbi:hypothetical protein CMT37_08955 [Elizabethkingia anophelis]|nr:hypothetical protein [Elizabethkingia anophelis]